ncbi:MAG: TIM barrel protein [Planctomycetota bacterium]
MVERLAEMGFGAIALRPRRGGWDHGSEWFEQYSAMVVSALKKFDFRLIIDLDSRFYDSPDQVEPLSLSSSDASERKSASESVRAWIDRVTEMRPQVISLSAGRFDGAVNSTSEEESVLERLAETIGPLSKLACEREIRLALRPVSGHAIETVAHFERFEHWLGTEAKLWLAADVGEMLLAGEFPIGARLARLQHRLACVYLCEPDLERGCDQRFGYGDIDLSRVWEVMTESGYRGPAIFRACGHDHLGFEIAHEAISLTNASER